MNTSSQPRPLYTLNSNSTRLMIGLKWDPRQTKATDRGAAGFLSSMTYIFTVILWIPSMICSIFTRRPFDMPTRVSGNVLYNAQNIDKVSDEKSSRENSFSQYDLDLYCYAYDDKNQFLFMNGPEDENMISDDGVVYSSGEDFTGRGIYDDESAYIDLSKISNKHAQFFIVVVSDSKYDFASLDNKPRLRIVDSKFEKDLDVFEIPTDSDLAVKCYAYIYAKLAQQDGVWTIQPIHQFIYDANDVQSTIESTFTR